MLLYVSIGYSYGQSPKAQITPSFLCLMPLGQPPVFVAMVMRRTLDTPISRCLGIPKT